MISKDGMLKIHKRIMCLQVDLHTNDVRVTIIKFVIYENLGVKTILKYTGVLS